LPFSLHDVQQLFEQIPSHRQIIEPRPLEFDRLPGQFGPTEVLRLRNPGRRTRRRLLLLSHIGLERLGLGTPFRGGPFEFVFELLPLLLVALADLVEIFVFEAHVLLGRCELPFDECQSRPGFSQFLFDALL